MRYRTPGLACCSSGLLPPRCVATVLLNVQVASSRTFSGTRWCPRATRTPQPTLWGARSSRTPSRRTARRTTTTASSTPRPGSAARGLSTPLKCWCVHAAFSCYCAWSLRFSGLPSPFCRDASPRRVQDQHLHTVAHFISEEGLHSRYMQMTALCAVAACFVCLVSRACGR